MRKVIISIFLAIMMMLGAVITPPLAYALTEDGKSLIYEEDLPIEEVDGQLYKAISFDDVARKDTNPFKFFSLKSLKRLGGGYTAGTPNKNPDVEDYTVNVKVDSFFYNDKELGFDFILYVKDHGTGKIIGATDKITGSNKYQFHKTKYWDNNANYDVKNWVLIYKPELRFDIRIFKGDGGTFEKNDVGFTVAPIATSIYKAEYFTTGNKVPDVKAKRVGIYNVSLEVPLNKKNLDADEYYCFSQSTNSKNIAWYKGKKINISRYGGDTKESLEISNDSSADRVKMYIDDPNVANPNPTPADLTGLTRGPGHFTQNDTVYHYKVTGDYNNPFIFTFREELKVKFDPNGGKWTDAESGKETEAKSYPIGHSMKLNEAWGDIAKVEAPAASAITPPEVKQNNQTVENKFLGWNTDSKASTALPETDLNNLQFTEPETTLYAIYSQQNDGKAKIDYIDNTTGKSITIGENQKIAGQTYPTEKEGTVNTAIPEKVFDKDSAPKILGYKFNRVELDPKGGTYSPDGNNTIKIFYDKVADVVPGTDPETKKPNEKPDGYATVKFEPGTNGTLTGETTFYVNPKANKTNADITEPTITAKTGFKVADPKWDPKFESTTAITADATYTAQYTAVKDVVPGTDPETKKPNEKPDGYKTVTFDLDGKGTTTDETVFYVNPEKAVTLTAPTVTGKDGYTVKTGDEAWNPKFVAPATYKDDKTFVAQYTFSNVSDTEVEGFNKVTFKQGDHGTLIEKSVWVQPDTIVDISDKAPKVTANKGYSHIGWKPGLVGKFEDNSEVVAQYSNKISDTPVEGWTQLTFEQGDHGKFAKGAKNVKWVDPAAELKLSDIAPEIVADDNYRLSAWYNGSEDVALDNVAKYTKPVTFTAQYKIIVSTEKKDGYTLITFKSGDHGKFAGNLTEKKVWLDPESKVKLAPLAPEVVADMNWSFDKWMDGQEVADLDTEKAYTATKTITAAYKANVIDNENEIPGDDKENFVKITFAPGTDGTFAEDAKTTTNVRKDVVVDITNKAPTVTAKEGKSFTGWDSKLVRAFDEPTTITAQYTSAISEKPVEGWTEILFNSGENGRFENGTRNVRWVDPNVPVKLDFMTKQIVPYINWSFDKWTDANGDPVDLSVAKMYKENTAFTGTYKSDISETKGEIKITFKPGDHGKFADGAKTTLYVPKDKEVDLTEFAPTVIPDQNYGHSGWNPALKGKFTEATDITAQYLKGTFKADELASIDVFGPTKLSYAEGDKLDLAGLKIVVRDKAGIQHTYKGAKAITDAGFTIAPANETSLTIKDHDKQPIKVSKTIGEGQDKKTIEGQTVSTLSVSKNKSADPKDVLARNLGENPQNTTVTGKAPEGSVIKVTDIDGKDLTDGTEVKADAKGEFTVTLKDKLAPGTPVKVTSTEPGKTESSPVVKQVFEDVNEDGTDDEKQKSAMPTDVKALNQNKVGQDGKPTKEEKETTTVSGKAKAGADIKIYGPNGEDITPAGGVKADQDGKFMAEVARQKDSAVIKVTAKEADKDLPSDPALAGVAKDADNDGQADGERVTLRPSALARNIGTGTTTPKTPATFTTVEGDTEKDATVTVSYTFNGQAKTKVVKAETAGANGLYTYKAELDDKLPAGTKVTVKAVVVGKAESTPTDAIVFDDLDGDKKPDGQGEVDFTKIVEFKLASNPDKMDYALASAEDKDKATLDPTGLKVFLKDASGNTGIYEYKKAQGSPFEELEGNENFKLELVDSQNAATEIKADTKLGKDDDQSKIKVSLPKAANKVVETSAMKVYVDANKNGTPDKDETTPEPKVTARNIGKDPQKTTVEIGTEKNAKVTIEYKDKNGQPQKIEATAGEDGKLTKEIDPKLDAGTEVKVTVKDGEKKPATKTANVFDDLDGNGVDNSKEKTAMPSILSARNVKDTAQDKIETKVKVKALAGATITVKDENGKVISNPVTVPVNGSEKYGEVEITLTEKQEAGKKVQAIAKLGERQESDPAESIVFDDLDGDNKPDGQGEVDFANIVDMRIASDPNTMAYAVKTDSEETALKLDGLTVYVKDKNGNSGIYQYGAEANKVNGIQFEELKGNANFKLELVDAKGENPKAIADGTTIKKANDANKIKVSVVKTADKSDTTGPLNVFVDANGNGIDDAKEKLDLTKVTSMKVISQPELNYPITEKDGSKNIDLTKMVVAVSDGVTTANFMAEELLKAKVGEGNEAKDAFKLELVKGTAEAEPKKKDITSVNGIALTTANNGNKVQIALAAKTDVKTETEALQVFQDLNKDGKPDGKETAAPVNLKALNKKDDKFTSITGKANKDEVIKVYGTDGKAMTTEPAIVKVTNDDGTFTVKVANKGEALKEGTTVLVTAQAKDKDESPRIPVIVQKDADGNGIADVDEQTPEPDVMARNIGTDGPDGKKVPATKTTVEVKTEPNADVTIEYKDANGDTKTITDKADGEGNLTKEIEPKLAADTEVKVTVKDGEKKPTDKTVKVFEDLDGDKIPDTQAGQTERPAAIASNKGKDPKFTSIEGKTEPGAVITVTLKDDSAVKVDKVEIDKNGNYTLQATVDSKPLKNGAEILVYAKNAPKTISNPQTTTVFNDFNKDGKPDGGKVDLADVKEIQVIAPKKMSYTQGETLDGTGLKAVITDNKGGIEIFDYDNGTGKFKDADGKAVDEITATVNGAAVKDLVLTEEKHDGKAIDVKAGKMTGSTNQKLAVKQLQTPTPTIEFAANQNTVGSDGTTATQTPKDTTTVKLTVANKPTTVYVKYTDNGVAKEESFEIKANDDATKTVELGVKLPVGAKVQVLAKDKDKTLSEPATANVVRDANNDGTADDKTKLKPAAIEDIKAGADNIVVTPPKDATELVISERDKNGETPQGSTPLTLTKDGSTWKTADGTAVKVENGKLVIPKGTFKLDEYNVVEAEAKGDPDTTTPSKAYKTVGEAADTKAPAKPVVDPPIAGDTDVKVKTPTEPDAKTITVVITKPGVPDKTIVVTKGDDDKWKTPDGKEVPEENGKLVVPVTPKLDKGDTVTVTTTDDSGNPSEANEQKVVEKQQLPKPTIKPIKTGDKIVAGKAEKAATVDIYKKNAQDGFDRIAKDVGVSPDGSYTYENSDGFKDGDVIKVVSKKPGMIDNSETATVGVDTSGLDKAIQDGKDALDPEKGGKDGDTPEDKKLKEAIEKGEEEKDKKPPKQEDVDKAKEDIEKAIDDKKKADDARDKLQDKIDEANDKKNDSDYDSKPDDVKKELDDAAKDGQKVHDDSNKSKEDIDKEIEKIQEKIDQYNKQQIGVNISKVVSTGKTIEVVTTAPNAKVEVFKSEFDYDTWEEKLIPIGEKTDITKLLVVSLKEPLPSGTKLFIRVTHPNYLSYEDNVTVE